MLTRCRAVQPNQATLNVIRVIGTATRDGFASVGAAGRSRLADAVCLPVTSCGSRAMAADGGEGGNWEEGEEKEGLHGGDVRIEWIWSGK